MKTLKLIAFILFCNLTTLPMMADLKVGDTAPSFRLSDISGKVHRLSQYRGKIVVLEWTNPECPFVQRHYGAARTMIRLATKNPNVVWLAIDSTYTRTPAQEIAWANKEAITYPILLDQDGSVGMLYGAKTTPQMFIISPKGKILYEGAIDNDPRGNQKVKINYVEQALKEIKAGKPVSQAASKPYGCSVKYK